MPLRVRKNVQKNLYMCHIRSSDHHDIAESTIQQRAMVGKDLRTSKRTRLTFALEIWRIESAQWIQNLKITEIIGEVKAR